mgnify:CR=1 FL=1
MAEAADIQPSTFGDDEAELLAGLRAGDNAAYEHLVRTYSPRLMAVAKRFLRDEQDAADALQDAFINAFRNLDKFNEQARLSTWLHRIVVNASLTKLRKAGRRSEVSIDGLLPAFTADGHLASANPAWGITPDEIAQDRERKSWVREQIERLPDDYRDIILLRDIEEMDTAETADLLGISTGAVKTRLHRARQALKALLEEALSTHAGNHGGASQSGTTSDATSLGGGEN